MEQITYTKTYREYKTELDMELSRTAEGFVRIGYLLKVARDTEILASSGYNTVTEFARAEYGIDKTMVSRFISINDKFAEGGCSDRLKEQYRGYGYAKLTLMLTLPEEITEELSPSYSKAEIQAIKDEVDDERAISDLEVMLEDKPEQPAAGILPALIRQLGEDDPELYIQMAKITSLGDMREWTRQAREILAPNEEKQYSIRISGTGRFMVSIRESEDTITTTALRTLEKQRFTYDDLRAAWEQILPPSTDGSEKQYRTSWEHEYNREYPGKAEVAPVQQKRPGKTESKPIPRKESKVQKAPKPKPAKQSLPKEEKIPATEPEKSESTGTEPVPEETEQTIPEKAEREPEKPEKTGAEEDIQTGTAIEEQIPGQVNIEEAIEEAERSYAEQDPPQMAAGQEQEEELDAEWNAKVKFILDNIGAYADEGIRLSRMNPDTIRRFRKYLIDTAALTEQELLRREENF